MAHTTFAAPVIIRYALSHPDDLGGFMLVYQKWAAQQHHKMVRSINPLPPMSYFPSAISGRTIGIHDEPHSWTANSALGKNSIILRLSIMPFQTLYIRGLINGHEVAAMIDTGEWIVLFLNELQ